MEKTLKERVVEYNAEIKEALTTVIGELNKGQRKKLLKNEVVKKLLERYRIEVEE